MADVERLLEASIGPAWKTLRREWTALTESYTKFEDADLVALQAQIRDYRGPVERITLTTYGSVYSAATVWPDEKSLTARLTLYVATDNRVDLERLSNALEENIATIGKRASSPWHGATLHRGKTTHHVTAGANSSTEAKSVVSAQSLKTKVRRWFVLNRDAIIVSLAGGIVVSVVVIVLQAVGVVPVP